MTCHRSFPCRISRPLFRSNFFMSLFFPDETTCRVDFGISITHACGRNLLLRVWRNKVGNELDTGLSLHSNPSISSNPKPSHCNNNMWIANSSGCSESIPHPRFGLVPVRCLIATPMTAEHKQHSSEMCGTFCADHI